jgi:hypothetical protein
MKLDGFDVLLGDSVYDLFFGVGHVRNLTSDGRAVVSFGARAFTYNNAGVGQHGRRSLYWHDPVQIIPMKDEAQWSLQRQINQAVSGVLRPGGVQA